MRIRCWFFEVISLDSMSGFSAHTVVAILHDGPWMASERCAWPFRRAVIVCDLIHSITRLPSNAEQQNQRGMTKE